MWRMPPERLLNGPAAGIRRKKHGLEKLAAGGDGFKVLPRSRL